MHNNRQTNSWVVARDFQNWTSIYHRKIDGTQISLRAGLALVFEDLVEQSTQADRAGVAKAWVGALVWRWICALEQRKLVGEVEGSKDGNAQGIRSVAMGGDGAHFGVDTRSECADVILILAGEVIDLVVDFDGDVAARCAVLVCHDPPLEFQCIELRKQPIDAPADFTALSVQGAQFFAEIVGSGHLLAKRGVGMLNAGLGACRAGFGIGAKLALAAHQLNGAYDALLERGKIVGAERYGCGRLRRL
jgi:hypothetical protein